MPSTPTQPAWKNGYVWMVLGGPIAVIIASVITFVIAAKSPDPVLEARPKAQAAGATPAEDAMVPAIQGRNHATTGGVPPKQ